MSKHSYSLKRRKSWKKYGGIVYVVPVTSHVTTIVTRPSYGGGWQCGGGWGWGAGGY